MENMGCHALDHLEAKHIADQPVQKAFALFMQPQQQGAHHLYICS